MRTIRTKLYKFKELKPAAQQKAIEDYRNGENFDLQYIYDEAHESVKAFHEIFGTEEGSRSWLDVKTSHIDDNILQLKGLRLQKYIWNNYKTSLYKGKYYSTHKDGTYKSRHSRITLENSCVLTGVCYDDSLLQPIYEFLEWKLRPDYNSYMDFESLIEDCFQSLKKDLEAEEQAMYEDEYIINEIEANEYEFTQDGNRF